MQTKIFVCGSCNRGFCFISKKPEKTHCPICNEGQIKQLDDWEQFKCNSCNTLTDVTTLIMHGNLGRIENGLLKCKYDENDLLLE